MLFDYIFFLLFLMISVLGILFWLNAYEQHKKREEAWLKDKEQRRKEAIKHLTGKD